MANEYYERLSEMNPGDLADGLAMEAEFDAISQGFSKLPTPHTGGQGFDGPVRVGDAVNNDEAVTLKQLKAVVGEAVLLDIATYGDLNATAWSTLPSNNYVLYGTGAQFSNTPYTLVAGAVYTLSVRHVVGASGVNLYHDTLSLFSISDLSNVDLRRLFVRTGSTLSNASSGGWVGHTMKKAALTALEALVPAADKMAYYTAAGSAAMTSLTAFARTFLASASASSARSALDAYGKNNIVGAVSQSGGVPTGAIVERGGNANGDFVKFADGTMVCWRYWLLNMAISTDNTTVTGFYFGTVSFSFPAAFSSPPSMAGAARAIGGVTPVADGDVSASNGNLYVISTKTVSARDFYIHYMALGRWF